MEQVVAGKPAAKFWCYTRGNEEIIKKYKEIIDES
jgi:hypothetical protein